MTSYTGKKCRDCPNIVTAHEGWFCEKCRCKSAMQSIYKERLCPACGEFLYKVYKNKTRFDAVICLHCQQIWDLAALNLISGMMEADVRHGK